MHGSWNRTTKQGYNVMRATTHSRGQVELKPFLDGFLTDAKADPPMWGRPVDLLVLRDGSMLVSDDYNGIIYRHHVSKVITVIRLVTALALVAACGPAAAAEPDPLRQKAEACVACHGADGSSTTPDVPSLAGQPKQFLTTQLVMFREGNRKSSVMNALAAPLSNADINALGTYFSSRTLTTSATPVAASAGTDAERLTQTMNCVQCHGADLKGQQHIPRIAGQRPEYLRAQLVGFHAGTRFDMDGNMTAAAQALTPEQIELLATYLGALR